MILLTSAGEFVRLRTIPINLGFNHEKADFCLYRQYLPQPDG
jgi:hypothetical protein